MNDEKNQYQKKPLQVSKAPPPIEPVRGGGYIPKPSTNDRLPRWSKWRLMPTVKEWEAVALSLNIEPGKVKTDGSAWMGAAHPFDEGDEVNDRLTILNKHASNRTHFPTPCILNMANWYNCEVRLDEFAARCAHVGFAIPPELSALAKAAPQAAPRVAAKSAGLSFDDFHNWSASAGNYAGENECRTVWKSFDDSGAVTPATLYGMAFAQGWKDPSKSRTKGMRPSLRIGTCN